jgi:hypothetical protein
MYRLNELCSGKGIVSYQTTKVVFGLHEYFQTRILLLTKNYYPLSLI